MTDNFAFTEGTGKTGAAKDIGGVLYPLVIPVEEDGSIPNLGEKLGATDETAPASDTATSGLNGRLQRIAQNLTTLGGYVDGVEALLTTMSGYLSLIAGYLDGVEAKLDSVISALSGTLTAALAAGTNLIGKVSASLETSTVYNGTTALTPKFAAVAVSSNGNNTIVSAVNPKKIRVLAVQLIATGAVNVKWQSGAGGTDLTGLAYLAANGGYVLPFNPVGWFETGSNTLLNLNLSASVAVGGSITYVEV